MGEVDFESKIVLVGMLTRPRMTRDEEQVTKILVIHGKELGTTRSTMDDVCRATGPCLVSFSTVNAFLHKMRGGRFSTDTQSDSSKCRVFGAQVKSNNFFRSGLRSGFTLLALPIKFYGISA